MNIYYVYAYLRSKDSTTAKAGTPYYIGKGKGNRIRDKKHNVSIPPNKSCIVYLETNLSDVGALALERRMIRWWGRKDLNTGILHNKTDGGEGSEGRIISDEFRSTMSEIHKGKPKSNEHRENMRLAWERRRKTMDQSSVKIKPIGRPRCKEETKVLIGNANRGEKNGMFGRKYSDEQRANMSAMRLGVKRGPYKKH